jgi:hypothetical protein
MKLTAMRSNAAEMTLSDRPTNLSHDCFQDSGLVNAEWPILSAIKSCFILLMALCSATGGVFAQDQTINGDLKVVGKTIELNGRRTHVLNYLSGNTPNPSTDSYRYEVARLCVNTYHWQRTGPIEVELRQAYWGASGYLKFAITAGFQEPNGSVTLLEKFGSALHANVSLGTPVATGTSFGGYPNQYIPVYVDLGNHTYWHVQLTHGWIEVTDDIPTTDGRLKFFANPAPTTLSGYIPSPGGGARLETREVFTGKIGVGTISPATSLDVNGSLLVTGGTSAAGTYSVKAIGADGADRDIFLAGAAGFSNGFTVQRVSNEMRYAFNHGNVGIGTTNPQAPLDTEATGPARGVLARFINSSPITTGAQIVVSAAGANSWAIGLPGNGSPDLAFYNGRDSVADGNERMRLTTAGNLGIGTTDPGSTRLRVATASGEIFKADDGASAYIRTTVGVGTVFESGNVGIGTTTPSHKLAVNGTVRAKEVIVDTGWADYVFKKGYRLAPLTEVEAHIEREGHLPGIPSAAEVEAGGVSLGDMQAKLLAKVEELTLHVIAQEKRQSAQETQISAQAKRIQQLETENAALRTSHHR